MEENYDWRPLEKKRVMALMGQDSEEYARLCYELGIEPENRELYEMGSKPEYGFSELEKAVDEEIIALKPRKRTISDSTYREFHAEGVKLSTNFWRDTGTKKKLLETYFPFKGNTENMSPRQIGHKFGCVLSYSRRRMEEKRMEREN